MEDDRSSGENGRREAFVREAARDSGGILREYVWFLKHSKKWWLAPIVIFLLLMGGVLVLGGTSLAPLIYTLF